MFYIAPYQGLVISMEKQTTSNILMIKPVQFNYNEQTAENNYFQEEMEDISSKTIQDRALYEFELFETTLVDQGINIITVNDTRKTDTPDSVFPNNWVSFHHDGKVGLYPMFAENRRMERRHDILELLGAEFIINEIVDFSPYEVQGKYLEGTGSMCLDRPQKIVYAALSERTDEDVLKDFCRKFDYKPITFVARQNVEGMRLPIYHTNVMMCVGENFTVICSASIDNLAERNKVLTTLRKSGKDIIEISEEQVNTFAGNMLEVQNKKGDKFLVMSSSAYNSLDKLQIDSIENHCSIIHSPLQTIEKCGGGSARCMMAEIFLPEIRKSN